MKDLTMKLHGAVFHKLESINNALVAELLENSPVWREKEIGMVWHEGDIKVNLTHGMDAHIFKYEENREIDLTFVNEELNKALLNDLKNKNREGMRVYYAKKSDGSLWAAIMEEAYGNKDYIGAYCDTYFSAVLVRFTHDMLDAGEIEVTQEFVDSWIPERQEWRTVKFDSDTNKFRVGWRTYDLSDFTRPHRY